MWLYFIIFCSKNLVVKVVFEDRVDVWNDFLYNTEGVWCKEKLHLIWFFTCGTWMGFVFEADFNMWFLMEQRLDDLGRWFIMWYLMDPTKGSNIMHVYVDTWLTAWCGQKSFAPATLLCTHYFFPLSGARNWNFERHRCKLLSLVSISLSLPLVM